MQERRILLQGERVSLAEMTREDQVIFHEARVKHPEVLRFVRDHGVPTLEAQYAWFERSAKPDRKMFSIVTTEGHELIGHCGFVDLDHAKKTAQVRITIVNPLFWGKGFGTEANSLLVRFGFDALNLALLWLRVTPENERARKSYAKLGFREEGMEEFEGEEFLKMSLRKG